MVDREATFNEAQTNLLSPNPDSDTYGFIISPGPDENFERVFADVRTKNAHEEIGKPTVWINGNVLNVTVARTVTRQTVELAINDWIAKANGEVKQLMGD